MRIPDNYDKWEQHEAEQQSKLARLPKCSCCDEPIQSEHCYEINGELICPECLESEHEKRTEDYYE